MESTEDNCRVGVNSNHMHSGGKQKRRRRETYETRFKELTLDEDIIIASSKA